MQRLWNKVNGRKIQLCFSNVIEFLQSTRSFCYSQEHLMKITELKDGETFVYKMTSCAINTQMNKTAWQNSNPLTSDVHLKTIYT